MYDNEGKFQFCWLLSPNITDLQKKISVKWTRQVLVSIWSLPRRPQVHCQHRAELYLRDPGFPMLLQNHVPPSHGCQRYEESSNSDMCAVHIISWQRRSHLRAWCIYSCIWTYIHFHWETISIVSSCWIGKEKQGKVLQLSRVQSDLQPRSGRHEVM